MKHSLQHLPEHKQAEITRIVEIIKEVVNPEMIILFGSYAKGTYVEHRYVSKGITYEYISDYDFLVVTKDNPEKSYVQESRVMDLAERFKPPVNLEIHEIDYINKGLEWGEYFWVDIVKEGILLHNKETVVFTEPRELTTKERLTKAQGYFNSWFYQGQRKLVLAKYCYNQGQDYFKDSLFELHQAVENLYYTTLLVFTDYKPKTHNLWKLRKKTKPYSEELFFLFPVETDKREKQLFELLKQGYVEARYKESFQIEVTELNVLIERVSSMVQIVEQICRERILSLGN